MRRVFLLSVVCISAGFLTGCDLKEVYPVTAVPTAGVRFINAVPDTAGAFGLDLRFVDELESNAHFRQNFRNGPATSAGVTAAGGVQFKATRAGSRQFRIFLNDTLQVRASVVLKDTTVTLEGGRNYTAVLWGNARGNAPAMRLTFFEETVADPGAQVALRILNTTGAAIQASQFLSGGPVPGTPTWASVPALSASTHVLAAPSQIRYNIQPAGGGANIIANPLALVGLAAFSTAGPTGRLDIEAFPGTTIAGSAVTMILFPPARFNNAFVAKHTTAVTNGTNRVAGSITALGGGVFRVSDCFVVVGCLIPGSPPTAPANPAWPVAGFVASPSGYWVVVVRPQFPSTVPPITVVVATNGTGTVDTNTSLAAYTGITTTVRFDVVAYLAGGVSIWDRRPPYIP